MKTKWCRYVAASLIALMASSAHGEEPSPPSITTQPLSQTIYKGVVGTLLDEVPIDAERRHDLQRGSAVISNTLSGRSIAVMLGVANPVLMAVGLAWGLFAASQIEKAAARATTPGPFPQSAAGAAAAMTPVQTATLLLCREADSDLHPAATVSPDESLALNR